MASLYCSSILFCRLDMAVLLASLQEGYFACVFRFGDVWCLSRDIAKVCGASFFPSLFVILLKVSVRVRCKNVFFGPYLRLCGKCHTSISIFFMSIWRRTTYGCKDTLHLTSCFRVPNNLTLWSQWWHTCSQHFQYYNKWIIPDVANKPNALSNYLLCQTE